MHGSAAGHAVHGTVNEHRLLHVALAWSGIQGRAERNARGVANLVDAVPTEQVLFQRCKPRIQKEGFNAASLFAWIG